MSGVNVAEHQEVDIGGLLAGRSQATDRRLGAEIAGRLMRQGEPTLVDARAIDDPLRIEPMRLLQVPVADHLFRQIASGTEDLYAEERMGGMHRMDLAIGRRRPAPRLIHDRRVPIRVSHFAHSIICHGDLCKDSGQDWARPEAGGYGEKREVSRPA